MWQKIKEPYEYNKDVPFEVAFKALKEGYIIRHANYDDIYLKLLNDRIYELIDRDGEGNCFEINEFGVFEMMMDRWQVLPPNCIGGRKNVVENKTLVPDEI